MQNMRAAPAARPLRPEPRRPPRGARACPPAPRRPPAAPRLAALPAGAALPYLPALDAGDAPARPYLPALDAGDAPARPYLPALDAGDAPARDAAPTAPSTPPSPRRALSPVNEAEATFAPLAAPGLARCKSAPPVTPAKKSRPGRKRAAAAGRERTPAKRRCRAVSIP
jgi:hypothetical protein